MKKKDLYDWRFLTYQQAAYVKSSAYKLCILTRPSLFHRPVYSRLDLSTPKTPPSTYRRPLSQLRVGRDRKLA
ncbi:hypothetical protein OUZ56_004956 [Daphnia magna]|uniref:Uncharacterized protein n=1 Tax=Daphnia magna TaxID=35525 RepID=A0ABQ9YRI1_9CRUS|nr:hypothetical protein OUZ56_004956 [Daphnia magna]